MMIGACTGASTTAKRQGSLLREGVKRIRAEQLEAGIRRVRKVEDGQDTVLRSLRNPYDVACVAYRSQDGPRQRRIFDGLGRSRVRGRTGEAEGGLAG
jgi:hypothetical protein